MRSTHQQTRNHAHESTSDGKQKLKYQKHVVKSLGIIDKCKQWSQ